MIITLSGFLTILAFKILKKFNFGLKIGLLKRYITRPEVSEGDPRTQEGKRGRMRKKLFELENENFSLHVCYKSSPQFHSIA